MENQNQNQIKDYKNTEIYYICCKDIDISDIYVGHTTNFYKRLHNHKAVCSNRKDKKYNQYLYKFIRHYGGWDNWQMVLIEKYPCNDEKEAVSRERYWFEYLRPSLNKNRPTITRDESLEYKQQYYNQNKNKMLEYRHEYYTQNKNLINEKQKNKYHDNIEQKRAYFRNYYHNVTKPKLLNEKLEKQEVKNTEIKIENV